MYRLGQFSSPTFSTPPQTHTSDRPIFKNSFDSENSGKFMRYYVAISLIFVSEANLHLAPVCPSVYTNTKILSGQLLLNSWMD